jgi:hypothetical protein
MTKNLKDLLPRSKIAIYLSLASLKDAQATGNAFSLQRTSSISKHELFSIFVGHFALLAPNPDPATQINADPGPKPYI